MTFRCSFAWIIAAALVAIALPSVATAQTTGVIDDTNITPVPGTGHDYIHELAETINPANGSLSIRIAAPTPHERGLNFPLYAYVFDSSGGYQLNPVYQPWPIVGGVPEKGGLRLVDVGIKIVGSTGPGGVILNPGVYTAPSGAPGALSRNLVTLDANPSYICRYYTNYTYTDAEGARHSLPLFTYYMEPTYPSDCYYYGVGTLENDIATDGTISAIMGDDGAAYVYDVHGNQLNSQYAIEDSNGNYLDGTGRTYSLSNGVLTIPGLGGSYTVSQSSETTSVSVPLGLHQIDGFEGSEDTQFCPASPSTITGVVPEKTTITLPDGQHYTIDYNSGYGLPHIITYPNGASVTYNWQIYEDSQAELFSHTNPNTPVCGYRFGLPAVQSRIIKYDGVNSVEEQDFQYTVQWGSNTPAKWISKTTTVTTKDLTRPGQPSFDTIYTYLPQATYVPAWSPNIDFRSDLPEEHTITYKDTQGNTLKTVTKIWSDLSASTSYNQLLGECTALPNGKISGVFYQYQGITQLVTDKAEFDYGSVVNVCEKPSSAPARETVTTYYNFGHSPLIPNNIFATPLIRDRPAVVKVYDNGTETSETRYGYDETPVSPVSSPYHHDEVNFGPASTAPRGNLTSVTHVCLQGCSADSVTRYSYDETGQVVTVTDPNGNTTHYDYDDAYVGGGPPQGSSNTYLTKTEQPVVNGASHITTYTYGYADGKMRSMTDANSKQTHYCYGASGCAGGAEDPWARVTEIQSPDGGDLSITYNDAGSNPYVVTTKTVAGSTSLTTKTVLDGYGHVVQTQNTSDPDGADTVDTVYDGVGQVYTVSNPYRSGSPQLSTYTYDSLGRPTILKHPDQTTEQWCYGGVVSSGQSQGVCQQNLSSNPNVEWVDHVDENGSHWQRGTDALGRMTVVMEPNPQSSSGNAPTMETDYHYDVLNNLLRVDQWGGPTGNAGERVRQFQYDSLGRLVASANPETGSPQFTYDLNGNLLTKTDARSVVTHYGYDALNRITGKSYTGDTAGSPVSCYQYDVTAGSGGTNLIGRLTNEWTLPSGNTCGAGPPSSGALTLRAITSYDPAGRVLIEKQCTPAGCRQLTPCTSQGAPATYSYDLAGDLSCYANGVSSSDSGGSSLAGGAFSAWYSGAGRLQSLSSSVPGESPTPLFSAQPESGLCSSGAAYTPFGALQSALYGGAVLLNRGYDANRMWLTCESDSVQGSGN